MIGKNTVSGDKIRSYIERVENMRKQKKDLSADEAAIWAEAKADGYTPAIMKNIIKRRAAKPADLEEAETMLDQYMHALGMLPEPPLFRAIGSMNVDKTSRESVLEALKQLVPEKGDFIVNIGSQPVRLFRNSDGDVVEEPWREPEAKVIYKDAPASGGRAKKAAAPDETPDQAEEMGAAAYRDNKPIISNPFPAGTEQRARFDLG